VFCWCTPELAVGERDTALPTEGAALDTISPRCVGKGGEGKKEAVSCDLRDSSSPVQEDVLGLDVSVHMVLVVEVPKTPQHLKWQFGGEQDG